MITTTTDTIAAVAAMSCAHGSYGWLCQCGDGQPFLAHTPVGNAIFHYPPKPAS